MNVSDDLKWNKYILEGKAGILSQLKKCVTALSKVRQYTGDKLFKKLSNGIFMSKLLYGAELWAGAPAYMAKKIQSQMIKVAHLNLGHHSLKYNTDKLMKLMGWLNISQTLSVASARITHQLVNKKKPELLSQKFDPLPPDENGKPRRKKP